MGCEDVDTLLFVASKAKVLDLPSSSAPFCEEKIRVISTYRVVMMMFS